MKLFFTTIFLISSVGVASAQQSQVQGAFSNSESGSASISSNYFEGSNVPHNTPSTPAPAAQHTAPCIVGNGFGISVPGFGIGTSGGNIEGNCNTRSEAQFLAQMLQMPSGTAKQTAIFHACANDESLRATLTGMGLCNPRGAETPVTQEEATSTYVQERTTDSTRNQGRAFQRCFTRDNTVVVDPAHGVSHEEATQACLSHLGY